MNSKPLALITGFGGNKLQEEALHLSYKNLIFGSLNEKVQLEVLQDLAVLQGKIEPTGRAWETISGDSIDLKDTSLRTKSRSEEIQWFEKLDADIYDKDGIILNQIKASSWTVAFWI